jgi:signal transduction histidine kinase
LVFHGLAWLVYGVVYYAEVRGARPPDYWQVVLVATVSGSLLSGLLALVYWRIRRRSLLVKVVTALVAATVVAALWAVLRHLFFDYVYAPGKSDAPLLSVPSVMHGLNALLFWSALYFLYDHYRLARENEIRSLRAESLARENQLKLLSYQLNPHFLFNVLNSIAAMSLKNDSRAAHETTVKLAEFLRYTLDSEPWRKVSFAGELECIERYLDIQASRFDDRLDVRFDIPPELRSAEVPNLILQPLIENAIKHTIAAGAAAVSIDVRARAADGKLLIEVTNSVSSQAAAQPAENGAGWGLSNVRERLEAYFGNRATMNAERSADRYRVTLALPFEDGREEQ